MSSRYSFCQNHYPIQEDYLRGNYQDIVEIGVFDNETILFEGQFPIPEGISSVSYTHLDVYKRQVSI